MYHNQAFLKCIQPWYIFWYLYSSFSALEVKGQNILYHPIQRLSIPHVPEFFIGCFDFTFKVQISKFEDLYKSTRPLLSFCFYAYDKIIYSILFHFQDLKSAVYHFWYFIYNRAFLFNLTIFIYCNPALIRTSVIIFIFDITGINISSFSLATIALPL